jgi:hypothetical protein
MGKENWNMVTTLAKKLVKKQIVRDTAGFLDITGKIVYY